MILSGVPNFAYVIGYTNASRTLKADLVSEYVCRLLAHLRSHGFDTVVEERDPDVGEEPFLDVSSGYVQRSLHLLPKQGWRHRRQRPPVLAVPFGSGLPAPVLGVTGPIAATP